VHSQTLHGSVQVPMYIVPDGQSNHQTVMFHQTMSDDEATHQVSNGIPKAIKTAHREKKEHMWISSLSFHLATNRQQLWVKDEPNLTGQ